MGRRGTARNPSRAKVRKRTTAHASTAALQEQVAALTQDVLSKTDNSNATKADNFPWYLEIALSGGGHRATAYALGALLYLVHAKLNRKVRNIASVSGASITNAFVASRCDFQSVEIDKFKPIAAELISKLERRGLFSVWTTWLSVAAVVALMITVSCLFVWIWWGFVSNTPFLDMWGGFMILSIVLSIALAFRGWIIDRWMAAVYFGPRRTAPRLKDISGRSVDHVFCSTDLCSGLPFFFSSFFGGRQISTFYGRAEAPFVPLQQVVRASSAFPPAIPAIRYFPFHKFLRANDTNDKFEYESAPPVIWLTDGGAYNNFGTEWHVIRKHVFQFEYEYAQKKFADSAHTPKEFIKSARRNVTLLSRVGYGDIQLIVDASQPERWQHIADLGLKVVELIRYVIRTMNIMYGSTLAARSLEAHVGTFARMRRSPSKWRLAKASAKGKQTPKEAASEYWEEGALRIFIPYSEPLDAIYKSWEERPRLTRSSKRRWTAHAEERENGVRVLEELVPDKLEIVPTTFRSLRKGKVLRLVVAGYLNTREGIYGPFDYLPEAIPEKKWFTDLSTLDNASVHQRLKRRVSLLAARLSVLGPF